MKRILSLILALIMVFSLGVTAFAAPADDEDSTKATAAADDANIENEGKGEADAKASEKNLIYTALGASESNGYGLPEYHMEQRIYKYAQVVDQAYPAMFARAIDADVFNQDCLAGMRAEDLLYLIDPAYNGDEYTHGQAFGSYVMNDLSKDHVTVPDLQRLYQKHIAEADVITLNIGLNNFGQYLLKQMQKYEKGELPYAMPMSEEAEQLLTTTLFENLRDVLIKLMALTGNPIGEVDVILRALAYSYTDLLKSFDKIVDRIYVLNPDAELYVLGLFNALPELYLVNDMVDIGQFNAIAMKSVNDHYAKYVSEVASKGKNITYVDVFDTPIIGIPHNLINFDGTNFFEKFVENNSANVHPSYEGHIYMYKQLAKAAIENGWVLKDIFSQDYTPGGELKLCFTDVSESDWFYDGVKYCYVKGYMQGTSKTEFSPQAIINRAQLVTTLYRMAGSPDISGKTEPFSDVSDSHWARNAIIWAYNAGIIRGVTDTQFAPNSAVTRGQAVTMLCRYTGAIINSSSYAQFKDANSIPEDFRSAVSWAVDKGIIKGYQDGCFHQGYSLSRAEMAVIISRYCES